VLTTFRLTEHHTAGTMSRTLPWLAELQPEMFVEIDPVLARLRGIEDGGWCTVRTARADIECRALVSTRMKPLKIERRIIHQVAAPWHWGWLGVSKGAIANDLMTMSGDPNTTMHESKAFLCDVLPGRQSRGTLPLAHTPPEDPVRANEDHVAEERPQA
jgi:formate dehydrogenase major subunit